MDLFMAKKVDELMYQFDLGDLNKNES